MELQQILQGHHVLRLTACLHCAHRLLLRTGYNVTETGKEYSATNKAIHNHFLYPTQPEWWEAFSKSHRLAYTAIEREIPRRYRLQHSDTRTTDVSKTLQQQHRVSK